MATLQYMWYSVVEITDWKDTFVRKGHFFLLSCIERTTFIVIADEFFCFTNLDEEFVLSEVNGLPSDVLEQLV